MRAKNFTKKINLPSAKGIALGFLFSFRFLNALIS